MPNLYDIFSAAASGINKIPSNLRMVAGALAGATYEGFFGDKNTDINDRIGKGLVLGAFAGALAPRAVRTAGMATQGAYNTGSSYAKWRATAFSRMRAGGMGTMAAAKKAFMTPTTMAVAGAGLGAMMAPPGYKTNAAVVGAGLGIAATPIYNSISGYTHAGVGGQSLIMAGLAVPIALSGAFRQGAGGGTIAGYATPEGSQYEPTTQAISNRLMAMNASGNIVLGSHSLRHG